MANGVPVNKLVFVIFLLARIQTARQRKVLNFTQHQNQRHQKATRGSTSGHFRIWVLHTPCVLVTVSYIFKYLNISFRIMLGV